MSDNERQQATTEQAAAPTRRRRRRRPRRRATTTVSNTAGTATEKSSTSAKHDRAGKNTDNSPLQTRKRGRRRNNNRNSQNRGAGTNTVQNGTKTVNEHGVNKQTNNDGQETKRTNRRRGKRRRPRNATSKSRYAAPRPQLENSIETSAGGLVVSGLAESVQSNGSVDLSQLYVALIGRLDRRGRLLWSMPKGHVENDEDHALTAQREVWEETGICGEVFADLGVIDYWFVSEGKRIHKTVHHHLLRFIDGDLNDEDPEVTEVSWVPFNELIERLAYADERKLARLAHDMLPELARKEKAEGRATPR